MEAKSKKQAKFYGADKTLNGALFRKNNSKMVNILLSPSSGSHLNAIVITKKYFLKMLKYFKTLKV